MKHAQQQQNDTYLTTHQQLSQQHATAQVARLPDVSLSQRKKKNVEPKLAMRPSGPVLQHTAYMEPPG